MHRWATECNVGGTYASVEIESAVLRVRFGFQQMLEEDMQDEADGVVVH